MKNLHALLLAAAFVSMPSTAVVCSEEVTTPSEESAEISTIIHAEPKTITKNNNDLNKFINGALILAIPFDCGIIGMIAGAAGSHSLKKVRRTLTKTNSLTPEILVQLNKGIRNNRIGMAASLALTISPIAAVTISTINRDKRQEQTQANDDLLREMMARNEQFLASDAAKEIQAAAINNILKDMQVSTDKVASDLAKELNKETV